MDYKFTEEYRGRFAFNGSERYWIEEAFKLYEREIKADLQQMIDEGKRPMFTPAFFEGMFKDINSKLDQWTE